MIKTYLLLTKPGIIIGNLIVALGAFLLASKGRVDLGLLIAALSGTALVIASACVFNNYIDRGVDKKMARTKKRALVSGLISGSSAIIYAAALGLAGFTILGLFTNPLVVATGGIGFFVYVVLYGFWKRRSSLGTVVGSISGAMPPVAGYLAATNRFDSGAVILFLILVFWQMPHFYAIATYRFKDYEAARLPVLPVKKGVRAAKFQIVLYMIAFILAASALSVFGYTGYTYLTVILTLGLWWLYLGGKGFSARDNKRWARGVFFSSLVLITAFSFMLAINNFVP